MRSGALLTAGALLALGLSVTPGAPASAASATATDPGTLAAALGTAVSGDTITLGSDIDVASTDAALAVTAEGVTLDLAGRTLTVVGASERAGLGVPTGTGLVIRDSVGGGALDARGGDWGAGIGGDSLADAGTITISGGRITAKGAGWAAGIGGGTHGNGGTTTISGGTVSASTVFGGAGIGGGSSGDGGTIAITGGTVHASAGYTPTLDVIRFGAAIGGGGGRDAAGSTPEIVPGDGGAVTIGSGATVTLSNRVGAQAIGGGGLGTGSFGSLSNAGTLTLNAPVLLQIPAGVTVANSGALTNNGRVQNAGVLRNTGTITNNGAFDNPGVITSGGTVTDPATAITGNNMLLTITAPIGSGEPADPTRLERVYAPTLAAAEAPLPAEPTLRPAWHHFGGWYLPDSALLTTDTVLSPLSYLRAHWLVDSYTVTFDRQDGSPLELTTAIHGQSLSDTGPLARTGHTFTGWFTDAAATTPWVFASDRVTSTLTLYAGWAIDSYTVRFDSQGGSAVASVVAGYGSTIDAPTAPSRAGHTFLGWFTSASGGSEWDFGTAVTGALTLHAQWVAEEPPVTPEVPVTPATPATPPAPSALPSTGVDGPAIAGGALALLAAGGALFLLRRRRA